jgi:hypothetical protein
MNTTLNSVEATAAANALITGQTALVLTQTNVTATAAANYELIGQSLTLTQNSTKEAVAPTLGSQNMQLTLHSMRMWNKIDPSQNANWTSINTTQSSGWTEINTAQNPDWTDIPT